MCPSPGSESPYVVSEVEAFGRFCDLLERFCGIKLGDDKGYLISSRLNVIQRETGCRHLRELVTLLESPGHAAKQLRHRVVDAMTTNETLWFRDEYPFSMLKRTVLPELSANPRIRIWSAACSTGQEPYSISMCVEELARERPGVVRGTVEVLGTDISTTALRVAREAVYAEHALQRGLSEERRRSHFVDAQGGRRPRAAIRERVQFRELNLLDSFALLGRFDVIFCRNVLIYFSTARRADILRRLVAALHPGGWLFLGGTESVPLEVEGIQPQRQPSGLVYRRV